jgi:Peptidase family S41
MIGSRGWAVVLAACGSAALPPAREPTPRAPVTAPVFASPVTDPGWVAVTPDVVGAQVRVDDGAIVLSVPTDRDDEVAMRHRFDVARLRGKRIRLTTRARTQAPATSFARATLSVTTEKPLPSYADRAATRATHALLWVPMRAVLDVPDDAVTGEIALIQHGSGTAWFDEVTVEVVGATPPAPPAVLSPDQLAGVMALARAAALIRYLHPSDQAAELDWDEFLPTAIDRVLRVPDRAGLAAELRQLFAPIAPTATFSAKTDPPGAAPLPRGAGSYLARWRRYGLGPIEPYMEYREGREDEKFARAAATTRVRLADPGRCQTAQVRASVHRLGSTGSATLMVRALVLSGDHNEFAQLIPRDATSVVLSADLPASTQAVELQVDVVGQAGVTIEAISLACSTGARIAIDPTAGWSISGLTNLYTWKAAACPTGACATLRRNPIDTELVAARDRIVAELGNGLQVTVPVAVWADATRTFPSVAGAPALGDFAFGDLPVRLAAIASAWGTLSIFYPYFADQHIEWLGALAPALVEAAAAPDGVELRVALNHLLVSLRDAQAHVTHPAVSAGGYLPIAFRRFGDKVVVTGGAPEYLAGITPGTELVALDGVPALQLYDRVAAQVSPSTAGLRAHLTAVRLSAGPPGTFRRARLRTRDGREMERVFPLVARELYDHVVRDARPAPGTELMPGIYYIDFDALPLDSWNQLLPMLAHARALIFDFRGYTSSAGFLALAHLTDRELESPMWQVPELPSPGAPAYLATQWTLRPLLPRLTAPVVALLDGQTASGDETVLQIIHDHQLGLLVGETSAGTNGNDSTFRVPGGYEVRFTAMRVANRDGTTIQGRGIPPHKVVHPTLEGVRAGRDEVLEAALAAAQQLAPK